MLKIIDEVLSSDNVKEALAGLFGAIATELNGGDPPGWKVVWEDVYDLPNHRLTMTVEHCVLNDVGTIVVVGYPLPRPTLFYTVTTFHHSAHIGEYTELINIAKAEWPGSIEKAKAKYENEA